eukprot:8422711-Pyramimonas_sp.AAC.1
MKQVLQAFHSRTSPLSIDLDREVLLAKVLDVCAGTAANASSMQQDVAYRRPTEIDHISGCAKHATSCMTQM